MLWFSDMFPAGTVRTMYLHCTYMYIVPTLYQLYVQCTYILRSVPAGLGVYVPCTYVLNGTSDIMRDNGHISYILWMSDYTLSSH